MAEWRRVAPTRQLSTSSELHEHQAHSGIHIHVGRTLTHVKIKVANGFGYSSITKTFFLEAGGTPVCFSSFCDG